MKLHITRDKKESKSKPCFGPEKTDVTFEIRAKLELTNEEMASFERQGLGERVFSTGTHTHGSPWNGKFQWLITGGGGVGWFECDRDVGVINRIENDVREGCKVLKEYVEAGMDGSSGSETIEL